MANGEMVMFSFVRKYTVHDYECGGQMVATSSLEICEVERAPTYQNYSGLHQDLQTNRQLSTSATSPWTSPLSDHLI